ncbi:MAG: hypothetical protein KC423_29335, partial [Anaerolineales bacterium]|nr:hypothetical protein [Anaerolineales bacterium]
MGTKKRSFWLYLYFLGMLSLLAACQTAPSATPSSVALLPTITNQPVLVTAVSTHTPTLNPTPETATPAPPTAVSPTSTATPEPSATIRPYPTLDFTVATPATAVPSPVPPFPKPEHITNIVLLGNDVPFAQGGRTDSIIIVSINRQTKTAVLLTLPRDLYVVIP